MKSLALSSMMSLVLVFLTDGVYGKPQYWPSEWPTWNSFSEYGNNVNDNYIQPFTESLKEQVLKSTLLEYLQSIPLHDWFAQEESTLQDEIFNEGNFRTMESDGYMVQDQAMHYPGQVTPLHGYGTLSEGIYQPDVNNHHQIDEQPVHFRPEESDLGGTEEKMNESETEMGGAKQVMDESETEMGGAKQEMDESETEVGGTEWIDEGANDGDDTANEE